MTNENIRKLLTDIFREVFDDENITISDNTSTADIPDWDSLGHITLIATIESEFDIKFSVDEVVDTQSVGGIISLLQEKMRYQIGYMMNFH